MKKLNGFTYSAKEYDGYKFRAIFEYTFFDMSTGDYITKSIQIYTDNPDRDNVEKIMFFASKRADLEDFELVFWATKSEDDATSIFLDSIDID